MTKRLAPRGGFEPPTFRLTAEEDKNLSAASGVAYREFGAILASLVAPNPAPKLLSPVIRTGDLGLPPRSSTCRDSAVAGTTQSTKNSPLTSFSSLFLEQGLGEVRRPRPGDFPCPRERESG